MNSDFLFAAKEEILSDNRSTKRYAQDSPPYPAPLSPKLPRTEAHPSEGNSACHSKCVSVEQPQTYLGSNPMMGVTLALLPEWNRLEWLCLLTLPLPTESRGNPLNCHCSFSKLNHPNQDPKADKIQDKGNNVAAVPKIHLKISSQCTSTEQLNL